MADLGYGSFNPKDPNAWQQFKQQGAAAVTGVNAMPYVLGGAVPYTWLGGQDRTVPEIKNWLFPGSGGAAAPAASTLQQLLGLAAAGGAPPGFDFLAAGLRGGGPDFSAGKAPSGDEDVSAFGLKGPRTISV